ncbi:MAG: hypothetical protein A2Y82_02160 [Candidatus Buchananbacteria bacterium RBG_13_36_9]|uniref:Uncharacterized protein n=1 Tax=Candidatus Buchananbacteria bacterium RBG_13_36_9 TaxID=1797530 RepID=A0A1G1XMT0_9BACT|nr:MAG: hypothetical protein A2Y82_02160 [Candidatus Buchananbacteria bacterium RBG_13_36_9]
MQIPKITAVKTRAAAVFFLLISFQRFISPETLLIIQTKTGTARPKVKTRQKIQPKMFTYSFKRIFIFFVLNSFF